MNPIDTDPRVTAEMLAGGKTKLLLITGLIKRVIAMVMGDNFGFVVLMRHKTETKTMLIFGDVDSHAEMSEIITEGYQRHTSAEMNRYSEADLKAPVEKH